MRGSELHLPAVPKFPETSTALAKNISQAAQTLSLPHTPHWCRQLRQIPK